MNANKNNEIVSVRTTFDGARVHLHANGEISFRTHYARGGALPAANRWRLWDDVCTYTAAEIPDFIRASKRPARAVKAPRRGTPIDVSASAALRLADIRAHMAVCRAVRCKVCR